MWSTRVRDRSLRLFAALAEAVNVSSAAVLVAPVVVGAALAVYGAVTSRPTIAAAGLGAVALVLVAAVAGFTMLSGSIRRILYGYYFKKLEIVYSVDEHDERRHRQETTFDLHVVRSGLRIIPARYWWSGSRSSEDNDRHHAPRLIRGAQEILGPVQDSRWWIYWIYLGRAQPSGTDRQIVVTHDLLDEDRRFQPVLAKTVIEPLDRLVLRVRLPPSMWPVRVEAEETIPALDRSKTYPCELDEAGREIRLDVRRPVFGHKYRLRWERETAARSSGVAVSSEPS
jgi:hypothetical protein